MAVAGKNGKSGGFSKDCSLVMKGILIIMLLVYHTLSAETLGGREIRSFIGLGRLNNISLFCKSCVSGFAFISAYGISAGLAQKEYSFRNIKNMWAKRLVKIESDMLFVYLASVIYIVFIVKDSIIATYTSFGQFRPSYALLDAFGFSYLHDTPTINMTWWYITFAIFQVLFIPALFYLYDKIGLSLLFLVVFFSNFGLCTITILGIAFAKEGWFEKIEEYAKRKLLNRILVLVICLVLLYLSFDLVAGTHFDRIIEGWGGALFAVITMLFINVVPIVSHILKFLGQYSMGIFMVHTFIFLYYHKDFVYSFKWGWQILLVVLGISLIVSIALELIKKLTGYNKLTEAVTAKLTKE